jgi:class 3 adenylate cyclase
MVLEPAIYNDLVELIAVNFKTDEINELGKLILKSFDSNQASGTKNTISLSSRKSAKLLVDCCEQHELVSSLIKLVIELDEGVIHGRQVKIDGLEIFLSRLVRTGVHYDVRTGRIVSSCQNPLELANWGCLREGKLYDTTVVSVDIMGNSTLVRRYGLPRMEKLYFKLWSYLREKLTILDGRIWSWAGDGGIIAFTFKDHIQRAVRFTVEVQSTMPVFNLTSPERFPSDIALRFGIDTGKVRFLADTGTIISDVINRASHLEKQACEPGSVSISRTVRDSLPTKMASIFRQDGVFEEQDLFTTLGRLDGLLSATPSSEDSESRFA